MGSRDLGFRVLGCGVLVFRGVGVWGFGISGFGVKGLGWGVNGCGVQGLGYGLGFRVSGPSLPIPAQVCAMQPSYCQTVKNILLRSQTTDPQSHDQPGSSTGVVMCGVIFSCPVFSKRVLISFRNPNRPIPHRTLFETL